MGYLTDWVGYSGLFIAFIAVLFIPGYIALRLLRLPRFGSLAMAPSWTLAIVGIGAIFLKDVSIGWFRASFALLALIVILVAALAWHHIPRSFETSKAPYGAFPRRNKALAFGVVTVVILVLIVPIMIRMDPNVPNWGPDPMFHYNGVNSVLIRKDASMFGAMDTNHGIRIKDTVYPAVWHGIVGLVASIGNIVPASHMLTFVVTPLVWIIGMTYLGVTALPHHRLASLFVPVMLIAFPAFPGYLTVTKGFWPNSLALAATPAVIGGAIAAYHRYKWDEKKSARDIFGVALIAVAVGVVGVTATHPSTLFSLVWVTTPTAILVTARFIREQLRVMTRNKWVIGGVLAVFALGAVAVVLASIPKIRSFLGRELPRGWEDLPERLVSALANWPVGKNPILLAGVGIVIVAALVIGLRVVVRHRHLHWIGLAWGMQMLIILGGYFPLGILTSLAGLWYHDMYRLFSVQAIFLALILALAVAEVIGWVSKRLTNRELERTIEGQANFVHAQPALVAASALALVIGLAGATFLYKKPTVYADAEPRFGEDEILNSREELEFIANLDQYVPSGSIIVGDPTTGVVYAPAYGVVNTVFAQVNLRGVDVDGNILANDFRSIEYDPRVCQILTGYGIRYYYEDDPINYQNVDRSERMPGLYNVDTAGDMFELVEEVDGARLWQITCPGDMEDPSWWSIRDRMRTIIAPPFGYSR